METRTRRAIREVALAAAKSAAASPSIAMEPSAANAVADRVTAKIEPVVEHLTNAEAWWRSRVTVGSIAGVVGGVITIATGIAARSTEAELYAGGISAVVGGGLALYGRWLATRPMGR